MIISMKKLLIILSALLLSNIFVSCEGERGPMGPAGKDGVVYYEKGEFTVKSEDWELCTPNDSPNEKYFRYEFDYNELTDLMCDIGIVNAYVVYDDGFQNQLPYTRHHSYSENNENHFYDTTIEYEYAPGKIIFLVTNSDFYIGDRPQTMTFRVITHY